MNFIWGNLVENMSMSEPKPKPMMIESGLANMLANISSNA